MRGIVVVSATALAVGGILYAADMSGVFGNDRFKLMNYEQHAIDAAYPHAEGVWIEDSGNPDRTLVFPQQVSLRCYNFGADERGCDETGVTFSVTKISITVQELFQQHYQIDNWDKHGLSASYGGGESDKSRCQKHVLTMNFDSGAVSVADIASHRTGCKIEGTYSYRLQPGTYYVDTTARNDADKPTKGQ